MSNKPSLKRLNPGSGQLCRSRSEWRGYRPPRSARKRWEIWMAFERLQKQLNKNRLKLPEQQEEEAA